MKQKIIKIGNSTGIILPQQVRKDLGVKLGDSVSVAYNAEEKTVSLGKKMKDNRTASPTPEFYDWLKRFNAKYKTALTELAKK